VTHPVVAPTAERTPGDLARTAVELKQRAEWGPLAALATHLPPQWSPQWLPAADEIAFGLGHLAQHVQARDLVLRAYELEPTHRRASALAYLHYDALLRHKVRKPRLDEPEPWRKGFERWIAEALRLRPDSIVDRYRLGVYHASIQTQKDALALRAFGDARRAYEQAADFRRRRYLTEDVDALEALARVCEQQGDLDAARGAFTRMARLPALAGRAEQELARLAG